MGNDHGHPKRNDQGQDNDESGVTKFTSEKSKSTQGAQQSSNLQGDKKQQRIRH